MSELSKKQNYRAGKPLFLRQCLPSVKVMRFVSEPRESLQLVCCCLFFFYSSHLVICQFYLDLHHQTNLWQNTLIVCLNPGSAFYCGCSFRENPKNIILTKSIFERRVNRLFGRTSLDSRLPVLRGELSDGCRRFCFIRGKTLVFMAMSNRLKNPIWPTSCGWQQRCY